MISLMGMWMDEEAEHFEILPGMSRLFLSMESWGGWFVK